MDQLQLSENHQGLVVLYGVANAHSIIILLLSGSVPSAHVLVRLRLLLSLSIGSVLCLLVFDLLLICKYTTAHDLRCHELRVALNVH